MQTTIKKCLKITVHGETKRLKLAPTYDKLVTATLDKFPNQGLDKLHPLKYYYLDEEQELIQITSNSDYLEALEIEELPTLKLVLASNSQEARSHLEKQINDTMSLAGSLNLGQNNKNAFKVNDLPDFLRDDCNNNNVEERRPETERHVPNKGQLADPNTFIDNMKNLVQNAFSEVSSAFTQTQASTNKAAANAAEEFLKMPDLLPPPIVVAAQPMQINTKSDNVVPKLDLNKATTTTDKKMYLQCTWCNGKPTDKPCRKCKGEGHFCYEGIEDQVEAVRQEIQQLCKNGLREIMSERAATNPPIHKDFLCDVCDKEIVGIRYKCTQRTDYDLCEQCEPKDTQHTFLKIRKPEHAPAKFVCKYAGQQQQQATHPMMQGMMMGLPADFHADQTIDMGKIAEMAKTFQNFCGVFAQPKEQPAATKQPESDLKMPDVLPPTFATKVEEKSPAQMNSLIEAKEDEYVLEDISIVEDLAKDTDAVEAKEEIQMPTLVDQLKTWTPAPVVEEPMSAEEVYKLEAAAETGFLRVGLLQLLELGFSKFARNKELLEKFNLNVEAAASALLEDEE